MVAKCYNLHCHCFEIGAIGRQGDLRPLVADRGRGEKA